jgi:hypothetical protein
MNLDKQQFANEAEKALSHPLVVDVIDEQLLNLGVTRDSLVYYGLSKIAMYAATVARAQALGIDPDELRATPAEANAALLERAKRLAASDVPTIVIEREVQP